MSNQLLTETRLLATLEDTNLLAREIAQEVTHGIESDIHQRSRVLILLNGAMGAGKTQFTKYLLEALGSDEAVSPSFAIHNSYSTRICDVEHFDLYRLESEDDLESTGFWDFFSSPKGVVLVEWASKLNEMGLESGLPRTWSRIELDFSLEGSVGGAESSSHLRRVEIRRK